MEPELGDRILTIPNALSALRLAGVPVFLWLVLGPHRDGIALLLLMASGLTDYLDGKLARMLHQSSKIGALLDPAADRLYIVSTVVALTIRGIIPVWLLIVLLARDVVLLAFGPVLLRMGYGIALPVHFLGKAPRSTCSMPSRSCWRRWPRLAGDRLSPDRLGVRHLGYGAVLVGDRVVCDPGAATSRDGS